MLKPPESGRCSARSVCVSVSVRASVRESGLGLWFGSLRLVFAERWIGNVARGEFADELILAAVAKCLQLCITTVPHTPFGNTAWAIAQHPMEELWPSLGITHEIVMGNNDVHYVWLTRDDMPP